VNGALLLASIPAPGTREISLGPFEIRFYALCLLAGVVAASWIAMRRWAAEGGDPELVLEVTLWSVLGGLVGARLYHVITSYDQLGGEWYAPFAIWEGGLGVWGGVLVGVLVGAAARRPGPPVPGPADQLLGGPRRPVGRRRRAALVAAAVAPGQRALPEAHRAAPLGEAGARRLGAPHGRRTREIDEAEDLTCGS
jgi:hypothetical protein